MLKLAFLGPPQITLSDSGEIPLSNRKSLALLAYLSIESRHPHRRESLLALLWPELATPDAQNNLRVTWSQLRKRLKVTPSDQQPFLLSTRLDLQFNPDSDHWLDVKAFESLLESCHNHEHGEGQTCRECSVRMEEAAELVRGEFLGGLTLGDCPVFDEWALIHRERLHRQITQVLGKLANYHHATGNLQGAERYVRRLLELDPLQENAHRQLMRLLSEMGQRSAALAQFETCRHILANELGVAPALETITLAERIRSRATGRPPAQRHNLPVSPSRFIGRQRETKELKALLTCETPSLVTLTGPGGVGKTRLAVQTVYSLVDHFADGVWLVGLSTLDDAQSVPEAVAQALNVQEKTEEAMVQTLCDDLHDKSLLVVMDNCEHLLEACAQLVKTLQAAAPSLVVLATSRAPLRLEGERVVRIHPLTSPDSEQALSAATAFEYEAVQLFVDKAAKAQLNFALNDTNAAAVGQICHNLDGIPLAIKLAAAQTSGMPVEAVAQRLNQRFRWLNSQSSRAITRQRTLLTTIDWSHDLLDASQRALFRRLSIFIGDWTLEAAEAICTGGELCLDLLTQLVDQSLVVFGSGPNNNRYRMHDTIQQYARQQLLASGEEAEVTERHARYYVQFVMDASVMMQGQPLQTWLDTIEDEYANLRKSFNWLVTQDRNLALTLVANLGTNLKFWELRGHYEEGRRWMQRVLDATAELTTEARANALLAAAALSSAINDFEYGLCCAAESGYIFGQLGNSPGEIEAQLISAELASLRGEQAELVNTVQQAIASAKETGYQPGVAKGGWILGSIAYDLAEYDQAIQYLLPCVATWRELDQPYELARSLNTLAACLLEKKDYLASSEILQETADINQRLGYRRGEALALHNLAEAALNLGDDARARELNVQSLLIRRELGLRRGYAFSLEGLAILSERENRYALAVQFLAAAQALRAAIGAPLDDPTHKTYQDLLATLNTKLGSVRYDLEWAKGWSMTIDQAIELVRG